LTDTNSEKLRILIVDDLEYIRKLVRQFLSKNSDVFITGEAGSGDEALEEVKRNCPDVILLDMSLPNISGIEVAKQIRALLPEVRIYFFSAYDLEEFKDMVKESIADGFIQKSGLKVELEQMVKTELERKKK
jgi:DNA-binding NarL/FixJ family response regulator